MKYQYVLRPVKEGMIDYPSLLTGKIKMRDIARMNNYLDVDIYNTNLSRQQNG